MKLGRFASRFDSGRGAAAGTGLVAGFLIALLIFGEPWHLPPNWGDIPTWLTALFAAVAGLVALRQLGLLRQQVADESDRNAKRDLAFDAEVKLNAKRDELISRQLAEADRRARAELRRQAEGISLRRGSTPAGKVCGYVENNSRRPITAITCRLVSKADDGVIAETVSCGEFFVSHGNFGPSVQMSTQTVMRNEEDVPQYGALPPDTSARFTLGLANGDAGIVVAWFTDDAEIPWRLDEFQHLAQVEDAQRA